eukprot:TRINITY_DN7114_c1_g3_i1.p1 TRINITY_DN7114_c1_g3~~TRINITY_DN7114_c1_g3_i1.p1  ORF type:complete len:1538 (+),score=388.38 TRINITY_DN7114_c1_g3_i1:59-4672(+)
MGKLVFDELFAKNLVNRDTFGKSDPFLTVEVNGVVQKTEVVDDNLHPTWKEQRNRWKGFEVDPWSGGEIVFEAWDDDPAGADFLGRAVVQLSKMVPRKPGRTQNTMLEIRSEPWCLTDGIKLQPRHENRGDESRKKKNNNSLGTLHVSFDYSEPQQQQQQTASASRASLSSKKSFSKETHSSSPTSSLTMRVVNMKAEDVIPQDIGSTSDPYIVMKVGEREFKTEHVNSTLNPVFKDCSSWIVDLSHGVLPELEFYAWDHDSIGGDDFLGYASRQLLPSDVSPHSDTVLELTLRVRPGHQASDKKLVSKQQNKVKKSEQSLGTLYVTLTFDGPPQRVASMSMPAGKEQLAQPPLYPRYNSSLRLTLLRCSGLIDTGIDPYVEIACENDKGLAKRKIVTTKIDSSTKNEVQPVWDHEYICEEDANDITKVTFQVKDSRLLGDTYIGYAELAIPQGRPVSNGHCTLPLAPRQGHDDQKMLQRFNRSNFGEVAIAFAYEVVEHSQKTPLALEMSAAGGLPKKEKLVIYIDRAEHMLWKDENIQTTLQIGKRVLQAPSTSKQHGANVDIRHAFELDVDRTFLRAVLSLYATGLTGKECVGVAAIPVDLTRRPTAPVPLTVELHPGDVSSALNRYNKVDAEDSTRKASLGAVTLSYHLGEVSRSANMEQRGHDPNQHQQEQNQWEQQQRGQQQYSDRGHQNYDGGDANTVYPTAGSAAGSPRYRTSQQPMYEPSASSNGDDLRFEIERAENLPLRSAREQPDAFVIVKRDMSDEEYKTCVVKNTADPRWQYACDFKGINVDETLTVSVFDTDRNGYDTFLGEMRLRVNDLLDTQATPDGSHFRRGSQLLVSRTGADGTQCDDRSSYVPRDVQPSRIFYRWKMKLKQDKVKMQSRATKPSVLDVTIHKASKLSSSDRVVKYAKITLNDTDERQTTRNEDGRWEQQFQYPVAREVNVARISVWDDGQYSRFLGEAMLELTATGYNEGKQTLELQPRNDVHYNSDDVKLLNSRSSGLGTIDVSWNFRTQHSRRQFPTESYTVVLNLIEAAELTGHSAHYVKVFAKGNTSHTRCSQLEKGMCPKFRSQFEFTLNHDYEELVIQLYERPDGRQDELCAEVSFPVGPTQSEAAVAEKSWCDMNPVRRADAPPRILYMWKAIADPAKQMRHTDQNRMQNRTGDWDRDRGGAWDRGGDWDRNADWDRGADWDRDRSLDDGFRDRDRDRDRGERERKRKRANSEEKARWKGRAIGGYVIKEKVGSGSFGDCFMGVSEDNEKCKVCLKIEDTEYSRPKLKSEFSIMNTIVRSTVGELRVPKAISLIALKDHNVLIQELLGPSIEELFQKCDRQLDEQTVLLLSPLVIDSIEQTHLAGIIHRDIKPHNFLMGKGSDAHKVYLIDFGLSKKYRHSDMSHIKFRLGRPMIGTSRYVGLNTHRGYEPSRRDDLEAIGYMFLYLLRGRLPWQGLTCGNSKRKRNELIHAGKESTALSELCHGYSPAFLRFIQYCRSLEYEETPDYDYVRSLFESEIKRKYGEASYEEYTWRKNGVYN